MLLALMPFGNSSGSSVPEQRSKIARRFNAGLRPEGNPVPGGRQKSKGETQCSVVPSGLAIGGAMSFPALKRWAIFTKSLRDSSTRIPERHYCYTDSWKLFPDRANGRGFGRLVDKALEGPTTALSQLVGSLGEEVPKPVRFQTQP